MKSLNFYSFLLTSVKFYNLVLRSEIIKRIDFQVCKKSAANRDWTGDLKIFSLTLSQLSYRGNLKSYFTYLHLSQFNIARSGSQLVVSIDEFKQLKWEISLENPLPSEWVPSHSTWCFMTDTHVQSIFTPTKFKTEIEMRRCGWVLDLRLKLITVI